MKRAKKANWFVVFIVIEVISITLSILDISFGITDKIENLEIKMIIGTIIKLLGIFAFIAFLSQIAWQNINHTKKIRALAKYYKTRIDWLETNAKTQYAEVFNEMDKFIKALSILNIQVDLKDDPKIVPIKQKFRSDIATAINDYNTAFKDWGDEFIIDEKVSQKG